MLVESNMYGSGGVWRSRHAGDRRGVLFCAGRSPWILSDVLNQSGNGIDSEASAQIAADA
jgi:hypothetical protein